MWFVRVVILILIPAYCTALCGQQNDWLHLEILKSDRKQVELILGKPVKYIKGFGTYRTGTGIFSVWYSKASCSFERNGVTINVPRDTITRMHVLLNKSLPLSTYVSDLGSLSKRTPFRDNKTYYYSVDESEVWQTITPSSGLEFVYSVSFQPAGNERKKLTCNK